VLLFAGSLGIIMKRDVLETWFFSLAGQEKINASGRRRIEHP
jgi:hypothetical protein